MCSLDHSGPLLKIRWGWIIYLTSNLVITGASLVAQLVKNLPVMQETWVQSLGWEDPLEEGMATPVFLPGEFQGQRSLVGYTP